MPSNASSNQFVINENPSEEEMKVVQKGLEEYNKQYPYGDLDVPTPDISLVLKDTEGTIVGGVITSMLTGVMHLEVLWVDKRFRRRGHGRALVLAAERIGKEKGYASAQTWTFSFQAPEFYQQIGYKIIGIFDGYTNGITEYVLMKRLETLQQQSSKEKYPNKDGFTLVEDASKEAMQALHAGLHEFVIGQIGELDKLYPERQIKLVIKNEEEQVIGGLKASLVLKTLEIEQLWIHENFRYHGYGSKLLSAAESIAKDHDAISGLTYVLSFQMPEFFQKHGYEIFGVSDGYPDPVKEYYFIKHFQT